MSGIGNIFDSIELIWVLWASSLTLFGFLTVWLLRRIRWPHLKGLLLEEHGGAYTISYMMVMPLYILLMCLVVETTLVIVAKFGTNYAAYAGVRSAIVYYTEKDLGKAQEMAQRAAVKAFVPFANGVEESGASSSSGGNTDQELYLRAARDYGLKDENGKPKYEKYLRSKYKYATNHLRVANLSVEPSPNAPEKEPWLNDLTVEIEYDFAFHIPIVGRLIGTDSQGKYYTVRSSATLQSEAPKNEEELLGINYGP